MQLTAKQDRVSAFLDEQWQLLHHDQAPRVLESVMLFHEHLSSEIEDHLGFYTLAVVAASKADRQLQEAQFRSILRQCTQYHPGIDELIAQEVNKPSEDFFARATRAIRRKI